MRNLAWRAESTPSSLEAELKAAAQAKIEATEGGIVLTAASANGASSEFTIADSAGLTPQAVTEMISALIDLYEATVEALGDDPAPTDAAILAAMLTSIGQPVRRFHSRYALHG